MDVAVWLRSLGLEQYETAFRDNAITEKLLPSLTAEDLKDLGVSVVGHRRALLNAIADLRSAKEANQAPSPVFETIAPTSKDTAAERRQVTVMFSDLVGSTALSARFLQASQWQARTHSGWPASSNRTAPQEHPPLPETIYSPQRFETIA